MTLFIFEIKINVCVRCTLYVYWTVFGVAVVRDEERRFFLFIFQYADTHTHTEHFQNSKQSNYGYRNFLHLSFTILFCYWNGIQWRHTNTFVKSAIENSIEMNTIGKHFSFFSIWLHSHSRTHTQFTWFSFWSILFHSIAQWTIAEFDFTKINGNILKTLWWRERSSQFNRKKV